VIVRAAFGEGLGQVHQDTIRASADARRRMIFGGGIGATSDATVSGRW